MQHSSFHSFYTSVYPLFLMKSSHTYFDLKENMEGYITDALATSIQTSNNLDAGNISVRMFNIPDIATITFDMELVNMTGSQNSRFIIDTSMTPAILDVPHTITNREWTFSAERQTDKYFRLWFMDRNFQTVGEQVRIRYNGKQSSIFLSQNIINTHEGVHTISR